MSNKDNEKPGKLNMSTRFEIRHTDRTLDAGEVWTILSDLFESERIYEEYHIHAETTTDLAGNDTYTTYLRQGYGIAVFRLQVDSRVSILECNVRTAQMPFFLYIVKKLKSFFRDHIKTDYRPRKTMGPWPDWVIARRVNQYIGCVETDPDELLAIYFDYSLKRDERRKKFQDTAEKMATEVQKRVFDYNLYHLPNSIKSGELIKFYLGITDGIYS